MAFFWLQDEDSNTLALDDNVQELTLGGNKRAFKVIEFAGAAGGFIRGFGTPGPKRLIVKRKEKAEAGDSTAWNSRRNDYQSWFTRSRTNKVWLYIRNGEDTFTIRTRVYATDIGDDKYKFMRITDMRDIVLTMPKGVYENVTATTATVAITSSSTQSIALTNNGLWETPITCKFTPTGDESLFSAQIADQYGFQLEKTSFLAGLEIIYNTGTNALTIDGETESLPQFLTAGGVFNIPAGSSTLNVRCSGPGSFTYEYNERYS